MKTVSLFLLAGLALCLSAEAKGKKPAAIAAKSGTSAKKGLIDLTPPEGDLPEGIISTEMSGKDVGFFSTALEIGELETWLGEQAKVRGEADKVKAVGDALITTQQEEAALIQRLAKSKGIILPIATPNVAELRRMQDQLTKLSGPEFDKAVVSEISAVTQKEFDAYQGAAASEDAELKRFAGQILGVVKDKLYIANKLSGKPLPPGAKPGFRENVPPPPPAVTAAPAASPPPPSAAPGVSTVPLAPPRPTPLAAPGRK